MKWIHTQSQKKREKESESNVTSGAERDLLN